MNTKKYAYVTFVMRNDSYIPGALVLAYKLQKMGTSNDLVCLVTEDVSLGARQKLEIVYDYVLVVGEIVVKHERHHERQDRPFLFTRFQALRLGRDGDIGPGYDKIVLMDADIMPLTDYDNLFELDAPAGIVNEKKNHWYVPEDVRYGNGKSIWHDIYEDICAHGMLVPKVITDKVWCDSTNMGINACLWVLNPNMTDYENILRIVKCDRVLYKISMFNWPEMQFATAYYSGRWHSIDIRYCAYNSHPSLDTIYGTHFAGLKPWNDKKPKALKHYLNHDDYRLWYRELYEMSMWVYPKLQELPKIKRILKFYNKNSARKTNH